MLRRLLADTTAPHSCRLTIASSRESLGPRLRASAPPLAMVDAASVLLVEDDVLLANAVVRGLRRRYEFVLAHSFIDGEKILREGVELKGFVVDWLLPGGHGDDLLTVGRSLLPGIPAVLVTSHGTDKLKNAARLLGASFLEKPFTHAALDRALQRSALHVRLDHALNAWASLYGLTEALVDVLRRLALREPLALVAKARGCEPTTVQRQVASILAKTGDDSREACLLRLLHEAGCG
jgi:FixJ family two-component response regulator